MTMRPLRSITRVFGPTYFFAFLSGPAKRMRPPAIATAWANFGFSAPSWRSTPWKRRIVPFSRTVSASPARAGATDGQRMSARTTSGTRGRVMTVIPGVSSDILRHAASKWDRERRSLGLDAEQTESGAHEEGAAEPARHGREARLHDDARRPGRGGAVDGEHDELENDRGDSEHQELKKDRPLAVDELGQDRHEEEKRLRVRELQDEAPEEQGASLGSGAVRRAADPVQWPWPDEGHRTEIEKVSRARPLDRREQTTRGGQHRADAGPRDGEIEGVGRQDSHGRPEGPGRTAAQALRHDEQDRGAGGHDQGTLRQREHQQDGPVHPSSGAAPSSGARSRGAQRQSSGFFDGREHDGRSSRPHRADRADLLPQKPPQVRGVLRPDLQEIAILAGDIVQLLHLGQRRQLASRPMTPDPVVGPHKDEGGQAQTDRGRVDANLVAQDDALLLQLRKALEDRRRNQADASSDFGVRRPRVLLEQLEDLQVDGIERLCRGLSGEGPRAPLGLHAPGTLRPPGDERAPRASTRRPARRPACAPSGSRSALNSVTTTAAHAGEATKTLRAARADSGSRPPWCGTSAAAKSITSTSKCTTIASDRASRM